MSRNIALLAAFSVGVAFALCLVIIPPMAASQPATPEAGVPDPADEEPVPEPPPAAEVELDAPEDFGWKELHFNQPIPLEWGTVFSINRVEEGGESYTFWFLGTDGTLRGVTTQTFTGHNRGSFFPEVYVIRRR